jgi:hypothetical protein
VCTPSWRDGAKVSCPWLSCEICVRTVLRLANWSFVDWMLNFREGTIQSTIKIRRAGLRIASTRTRALGGSSPDFAICASSPNGSACVAFGAAMNALEH